MMSFYFVLFYLDTELYMYEPADSYLSMSGCMVICWGPVHVGGGHWGAVWVVCIHRN